jgi:magnesium transporter
MTAHPARGTAAGTDPGTVGAITSTAVPTCRPDETGAAVLNRLVGRRWDSADTVSVVEDGRLRGRFDVADLLASADGTPVREFAEPARARLRPDADRERAVVLAIRWDRDDLPVVDADGRFVGAVTAGTIVDVMHHEHVEDVLLGAGIRADGPGLRGLASGDVRDAVRRRVPWLLFGLGVGLRRSLVTSRFEATLRGAVAVAFFVLVVASIADSVGTQSEAIAVRALAVADVDYGAYLLRELAVGLAVGALLGALGGVGAAVVAGTPRIGVVVALSLFVSSVAATVLASLVPIGFATLDVDPALGSGPLATAIQDLLSIVVYVLLATALP